MLQKSGRLVLWEAMFILELHSAETQDFLAKKKAVSRLPQTVDKTLLVSTPEAFCLQSEQPY